MSGDITMNAQDVINTDLEYICSNLETELGAISGRKLLISGGAGFLGYYLIQAVLYRNKKEDESHAIHITVYDNYIRGLPDWLNTVKKDKNLSLVKHDITTSLPKDINDFDYIIHAASIASPTFYRKYPIETMDANVNGLRLLLDYCRQQKEKGKPVASFLFFSSSEVYGDPPPGEIPTSEDYNGNVSFVGPRACYDESKRYGETLCVNFVRQYDLPIKIARPFNNYGPGLRLTDRRVIPDFASDILKGRNITILSDGSPTRTFCYVADAINGYYKILIRGRKGEAYNIGVESPQVSSDELAHKFAKLAYELLGYKEKIVHQVSSDPHYLVNNPSQRCPVIAKARSELGYNPSISLEEGLKRSLIWYRDNSEAEVL